MNTDSVIDPARFEKIDESECLVGDKLRNWPSGWPEERRPNRLGEFLSKIWAHYGPPNQIEYEGFNYCFLDRENGKVFSAYSAGTGPAFNGQYREYDNTKGHMILEDELSKLTDSVKVFEELLENTTPANCEIQFDTDFGVYRAGAQDGVPFEEPVETNSH